jgi:hypothetical protein
MSVYVVTWNINKERANYSAARQAFVDHLNRHENLQDSGLETVRWISSSWTARQISDDLQTKLDKNDRLYVSKIVGADQYGWLSQSTWDWINARL